MIILDTDVLTLIQSSRSEEYWNLVARLDARDPEPIFVTIISYEEQMRGWLAVVARARNAAKRIDVYRRLRLHIEDFCSRPLLDFDEQASGEFDRLTKARLRLGTMDLKIAAIALANNATLVTRNLVDFAKVPNLRCEDWTTS